VTAPDVVAALASGAIERFGYWALGISMIVMAPEAMMPFAGFLAHQGHMNIWIAVVVGTVGGTLGSTFLYLVARQVGEARVRAMVRRRGRFLLLREGDLDRLLGLFDRHGDVLVGVGRLVPTMRSLISLPAGLLPMPFGRFLLLTFSGTLVWNGALGLGGYLMGVNWRMLESYLGVYGAAVISVFVLAVALFLLNRWREQVMTDNSS
jgi:membrane protein DedA with SNARE-associated domain